MKFNLYAIKDTKNGFSTAIFASSNHGNAIRMFGDTCQNDDNLLHKHPEDFELYCLGTYNDDNGEITSEVKYLDKATNYVS